jgi:hypothetical protein
MNTTQLASGVFNHVDQCFLGKGHYLNLEMMRVHKGMV